MTEPCNIKKKGKVSRKAEGRKGKESNKEDSALNRK